MKYVLQALIIGIAGLITILISAVFYGFLVMLLWNWIVVALFATVPAITYIQGFGLYVLCGLLFKSSSKSSD